MWLVPDRRIEAKLETDPELALPDKGRESGQ
jgi:hypothetical protein